MSVENPIKVAREGLGLSRAQLAVALERSYSLVAALEAGSLASLHESLRPRVEAIGLDFDELADRYARYRAAWGRQVTEKAVSHD